MEDDGVACELVEVGDGSKQDRGGSGDGDQLARTNGGINGQQWISVVSYRLDLDNRCEPSAMLPRKSQRIMYLGNCV